MDASLRIEPSFYGVMNQVPCTPREDCRGLKPAEAQRLQHILQKISGISSQKVRDNTYLEFVRSLYLPIQNCSYTDFIRLAHSVAMEKLLGKDRVEALASSAQGLIQHKKGKALISLVKELGDTGENALEYQLEIVKSLCACPQPQVWVALEIVKDVIKFGPRTIETLALIAKDQAEKGNLENAELIEMTLMLAVLFPTASQEQILKDMAESIRAAKENALEPLEWRSDAMKNLEVFNQLKKEIEEAYTTNGKAIKIVMARPQEYDEHFVGVGNILRDCVFPSLANVAKQLIKDGMVEQLFEVVEAIQNRIVAEGNRVEDKLNVLADIALILSHQEHGDEYIARIINHGRQDKSVDINLVWQIVAYFTEHREPKKALSLAEQYLNGSDLMHAFDIFAQKLIIMDPSLLDSIFHFPLKEKGKLFVSIVGALAQIKTKVQCAQNLIEQADSYSIPKEDQSEAFIRIAKAEIERKEEIPSVLGQLVLKVSEGKSKVEAAKSVKKSYIRLTEEMLQNKKLWQETNEVLNRLKGVISSEALDPLLAKAAIAEVSELF